MILLHDDMWDPSFLMLLSKQKRGGDYVSYVSAGFLRTKNLPFYPFSAFMSHYKLLIQSSLIEGLF